MFGSLKFKLADLTLQLKLMLIDCTKKCFYCRRGGRSDKIWRFTKKLYQSNKNYKTGGNVVLATTKFEKELLDRFLFVRKQIHD